MNKEKLTYYCKDCSQKINTNTALYKSGLCRSCARKKRKINSKWSKILTKLFLQREYVKNRKFPYQIAKEIGCSYIAIRYWLKKYSIHIRTKKEECNITGKRHSKLEVKCEICGKKFRVHFYRIKITKNFHCNNECRIKARSIEFTKLRGSNHWNWQDGISPLNELIRRLPEYKNWRKEVFKRDDYKCQDCGQIGGNLNAHHKIPFAKLFIEFLNEYNQFSPIEDKETLVRLAIKWKPFWNIDNGKTLCEDCHKNEKTKRTK